MTGLVDMTSGGLTEIYAPYEFVDGRKSLAASLEYALVDADVSRLLIDKV